ncbi:MAG: HAD-IC family P-type ATPase, partial [Campylobacterota bacterium]|nr:HAD-IC family P-type ATPase [Campylobacterota bacterium]
LSLGAQKGILFKEAGHLETMANVDTLVLDKTGTITIGKPEVIEVTEIKEFDINLLYSVLKSSKHPVALGVLNFIKSDDIKENILDEYNQIASSGIVAKYQDKTLFGGNLKLMRENGIEIEYESDNTLFYYAIDDEVVAIYELRDKIKENAKELVSNLQKRGIKTIMLTGDNDKTAQKVAVEVGIKEYISEQTPKDKSEFIEQLHHDKKVVVMVGDGVNDILALAQSDIGIVMGSGSDIAVDVGDVVLLNDTLNSLEDAFKISATTYGLIKQNLGISLVYNSITVPLAIAGYVIPLVAAISMSVSSLLVVGNSMRIRYKWNKG